MCLKCLSNSNSSVYVLKRSIVLLWWLRTGFLFVFTKACSHDATRFLFTIMLIPKKWFMNQWIWKELCTSINDTLSTFSQSPHVQVLQTLARSFIKFIHWALKNFSVELNRKLQSSVNSFHYCTVKELLFSEDFYHRSDWQVTTNDFTTTSLCKARGRLVL